jgi:hypothetical protein
LYAGNGCVSCYNFKHIRTFKTIALLPPDIMARSFDVVKALLRARPAS